MFLSIVLVDPLYFSVPIVSLIPSRCWAATREMARSQRWEVDGEISNYGRRKSSTVLDILLDECLYDQGTFPCKQALLPRPGKKTKERSSTSHPTWHQSQVSLRELWYPKIIARTCIDNDSGTNLACRLAKASVKISVGITMIIKSSWICGSIVVMEGLFILPFHAKNYAS